MKISVKTLAAARKAAKEQGMSLDAWAEQVLADAASANQASTTDGLLKTISSRIDQVVDRQNLSERVNEQLSAAIKEASASYEQAKKATGQILGDVSSKTSAAVEEVAGRARELFGQMNKSAADLSERVSSSPAEAEPPTPSKKPRAAKKTAAKTTKAAEPKTTKPKAAKPKTPGSKTPASKTMTSKKTARRPAAAARKTQTKRPGKKT